MSMSATSKQFLDRKFTKGQKLYCYAKANQMVDHRFTDDVAICWAHNKMEAWHKMYQLYGNCYPKDVFEVHYTAGNGVAILTDY